MVGSLDVLAASTITAFSFGSPNQLDVDAAIAEDFQKTRRDAGVRAHANAGEKLDFKWRFREKRFRWYSSRLMFIYAIDPHFAFGYAGRREGALRAIAKSGARESNVAAWLAFDAFDGFKMAPSRDDAQRGAAGGTILAGQPAAAGASMRIAAARLIACRAAGRERGRYDDRRTRSGR